MNKGWIKIHRKILNNPLVKFSKNYSYAEAWLYLLLRAAYQEQKVLIGSEIYYLKAGEIIDSQKKLCKLFGWGNTRLRTFLKLYEKDEMIKVKTNSKLTHLTIINYESNQLIQTANKSKTNQKQTHSKKLKKLKEDIDQRSSKFHLEVLGYGARHVPMIDPTIIESFVNYWTEKNRSGTKMLFETKRTFEISKRMATWLKNEKDWNKETRRSNLDKRFPFDKTGNSRIGYCNNPKCKNPTNFLDKNNPSLDSTCCSGFKVITKQERDELVKEYE